MKRAFREQRKVSVSILQKTCYPEFINFFEVSLLEEKTLIIIKPDGVKRHLIGRIINRFEERLLTIDQMRYGTLTEETAKAHYAHLADKPFFQDIIDYMTSGPVVFIVLKGENAIEMVRKMIGQTNALEAAPGTIRGDFATNKSQNVIHASDCPAAADVEIKRFFSDKNLSYVKQ